MFFIEFNQRLGAQHLKAEGPSKYTTAAESRMLLPANLVFFDGQKMKSIKANTVKF